MRIIGGKFKNRKLQDCHHLKTLRPTTDKTKEAIFNLLSANKFLLDQQIKITDSVFLDACCGTGSIGLEAISRGAKKTFFIENNSKHLAVLQNNIKNLGIQDCYEILNYNIEKIKNLNLEFDIIFLDPPYQNDYEKILKNLINQNFFSPKTLLIIEIDSHEITKYQRFIQENFMVLDQRKYGKNLIGFYKIIAKI
jgi:16S rRNA (guanine966-N2)-methyltransferase